MLHSALGSESTAGSDGPNVGHRPHTSVISVDDDVDNARRSDDAIRLAVDAMGGYEAPEEVVAAVADASTERHPTDPVYFTLVGNESALTRRLLDYGHNPERIRIQHAPASVHPREPARTALASEPTSIELACELVADGRADAVVTAGHPGAAVLTGKRLFERVEGVRRTALCAVYPTPRERTPQGDRLNLLLDVGASHSADARDLHNFAAMGSAYASFVSDLESPRIALLSTSPETGRGPAPVAEAADLIAGDPNLRFHGNYEGHDIPGGEADVVVCNGYVGNVTIKLLEGVAESAFDMARAAYRERFLWRIGLRLLSGGLTRLKKITDFEEYGGAPVLGLKRVMIVAHARSRRKAIGNALRLAIKNVKTSLPRRIGEILR